MPEILWAPWRIKYIECPKDVSGKVADIFIDLPEEGEDRKNLIVYRGVQAFVMLNAFPYSNGHLLIAPYRQVSGIDELSDPELLETNQLVAKAILWLRKVYNPDGFNVGINMGKAAGAGIPNHVHWHIVPRWNGDTNFMTTVGDARVIPESLERTYDRLAEAIGSFGENRTSERFRP